MQSIKSKEERSAFIAIIGRPNVGKSSLLNKILGQKVAIVSNKPQTTRTRIMGVLTVNETQLCFVDTPGFHKPRNLLGKNMVKAVGDGITDVDAAILVVDAAPDFKFNPDSLPPAEIELIETLKTRKIPCYLVINKIDTLANKEELLTMITAYSNAFKFESVIPLSAKTGDGVDILKNELLAIAPIGTHYFPDDEVTDQPEKVMVAEMIREKLLRNLKSEVPHGIAIGIERFLERDNKNQEPIIEIEAIIYCERESHKSIIIGKGGAMLKKIGTHARYDIEQFYGTKVSLKLWVKVKEDWRNREGLIHSFGLD